ncbi:MAG: hypothetical protein IJF43_03690 [Firmicutes bacterium]|nr:hypothetical protein [Bacillota bacterium]
MPITTASLSALGRDHPISAHFTLGEFASKDGADLVKYSTELLALLETLRSYGGFTIAINSGYRTAAYNRAVGGASKSQHVEGTAADITVKKDGKTVDAALICCLCQLLEFPGVAYISPRSLHVDARKNGTYRGDERKGYRNNVDDFFTYFNITKAEVRALKTEEEDDMTQERFNQMMDNYLASLAQKPPQSWSADARTWAEQNGIIRGDELGNKAYRSFCTREELVAILFRMVK